MRSGRAGALVDAGLVTPIVLHLKPQLSSGVLAKVLLALARLCVNGTVLGAVCTFFSESDAQQPRPCSKWLRPTASLCC